MNKIKYKMMKTIFLITGLLGMILFFNACVKNLNVTPINPNLKTASNVYKTIADYNAGLAKLYGGYSIADGDVSAINPDGSFDGYSTFTRVLWMTQCDWTDEAWWVYYNDVGLGDMRTIAFNDLSIWPQALYYRILYEALICNQFLKDASDAELAKKAGLSDADKDVIKTYRNEARFLRALAYYYGLDNFRRIPFVTENDPIGAFFPKQSTALELYNFIESELKDLETQLPDPSTTTLARADKAAAWALLAKLNLNAGVYLGYDGTAANASVKAPTNDQLTNVITYCNKIINDGYHELSSTAISTTPAFTPFQELFMGDNGKNPNAQKEFVFSLASDHNRIQGDGSANFIINGFFGDPINKANYGVKDGWSCLSVREKVLELFGIPLGTMTTTGEITSGVADDRKLFYGKGIGTEIAVVTAGDFKSGYSSTKFRGNYANTSMHPYPNDVPNSGNTATFNNKYDTYYPIMRMGDIYLMLAEAYIRQGNTTEALTNLNLVRNRAHATPATTTDMTLAYIRDERGRELHAEGHRRTDLIRLGFLTGANGYTWDFKGGILKTGTDIPMKFTIFPIPASDLTANPNLKQNLGY